MIRTSQIYKAIDETPSSVQIANQIANIANAKLAEGVPANEIASGLRRVAAHFTALNIHQSQRVVEESGIFVDDFLRLLSFYLNRPNLLPGLPLPK
jgi:hypothetical protein